MTDFASNPTFIAPVVAPYLGQPTKVAMTGAQRANGFVPGMPVAAEHLNSELNARDVAIAAGVAANDAITPLTRRAMHIAMLQLQEIRQEGTLPGDISENIAAVAQRQTIETLLLKSGNNGCMLTSDLPLLSFGDDVASITSAVTDVARNGNRLVVIGTGGVRCAFSTDNGANWSAGSDLGATPSRIVWNDVHGRFMATFAAGANVANDTNAASTWTSVSSGLDENLGGIAVLANGDAIVHGKVGSVPSFARSTNGGGAWSTVVPTGFVPGDYGTTRGTVVGNGGSTIYHVGRVDGDNDLRVCSSTNGTAWTTLAELECPDLPTSNFNAQPRILMCQNTGLLVIVCELFPASVTAGFASADGGLTWTKAAIYDSLSPNGFAVAGGRLFAARLDMVFASSGIGW